MGVLVNGANHLTLSRGANLVQLFPVPTVHEAMIVPELVLGHAVEHVVAIEEDDCIAVHAVSGMCKYGTSSSLEERTQQVGG